MVRSTYSSLTYDEKIQESDLYSKRILNTLKNEGIPLSPDFTVLDLGCGAGLGVYSLRKLGIMAYGSEFSDSFREMEKRIFSESLDFGDTKVFSLIDRDPYRLPFPDNSINFCYSKAVFEHVTDYEATLKEIKRILKPGGTSIHNFVSKYKIIEDHTYVPFSSIYHGYYYLLFWAILGIRNEYQEGKSAKDVAELNHNYLEKFTNYLSKNKIKTLLKNEFDSYSFENNYLRQGIEQRVKSPIFSKIYYLFYNKYFSTFKYREIFFRK